MSNFFTTLNYSERVYGRCTIVFIACILLSCVLTLLVKKRVLLLLRYCRTMDSRGGRALAKAVTTYLLNTTELRTRPNLHAVWAVMNDAVIVGVQPRHKPDASCIVTSTGSVAELYIDPLAQCFNDYDTMYHFSDMIAIPAGHPIPRRLPGEFHDEVNVHEIIDDSSVPGYVYLVLRYQLRRSDDDGDDAYSWTLYDDDDLDDTYLLQGDGPRGYTHGPATVQPISNVLSVITGRPDEPDGYVMSLDWVYSVRCLVWPPQAARWPGRVRQHGCVDPSMVDRVVADGCHLVPVAHQLYRDNEWIGKRQWRLSFSKAECQLINNWTPMQQIVYHVLRSVMKIAKITTDEETTVVSNYHIKTLMLWATELHPAEWWSSGDSCLITAAASLLNTLSHCLGQRYCQHYFVDEANLFMLTAAQSLRVESMLTKLWSVSDFDQLSTTLFEKYVRPCVLQVCPDSVSQLLYDVRNVDEVMSAVVAWRRDSLRERSWRTLDSCSHGIERCICAVSLTARSCRYFLERLHDVELRLVVHFVGFTCLHVAYRLATGKIRELQYRDQLLDVLSAIFCSPGNVRTWRHGNPTPISKAAAILKAIARRSYERCDAEQLILMELSKAYLYRELSLHSSGGSSGVFSLANAYLAAMYYDEERYEVAIDHCKLAHTSEAQRHCEHVVQVELLPRIDDVNRVLGIGVLYQFIRADAISHQPQHAVYFGVLTGHLFANFLHIICLRHRRESREKLAVLSGQLCRYRRTLLDCEQPLVSDILLFGLTTSKLRIRPTNFQRSNDQRSRSLLTWNSSELVALLTQSAVERLTTFRGIQTRDFGGDIVPGTTDFLAMHAFRRGCYVDCMRLCQNNVENFGDYVVLQEIFMTPEFIFLMGDCDLVSVVGLALVVVPEARYDPKWQFVFRLSQLSLALYLYTECQLRLHHSMKSLRETQVCANLAGRHNPFYATLNTWTLQLINRKITDRLNVAR